MTKKKVINYLWDAFIYLREELFTRIPHKHLRFEVNNEYAFCTRCYRELP